MVLSDTSRMPRLGEIHGKEYFFNTWSEMDEDISNHQYIECGELRGQLYGTKLSSGDLVI